MRALCSQSTHSGIADGPTPISREEIPKIIPSTHRYGKPMVSPKKKHGPLQHWQAFYIYVNLLGGKI